MNKEIKYLTGLIGTLIAVTGLLMLPKLAVHANNLTEGSMSISDGRPSITNVTYTATFSNVDTTTQIACISLEFDTNQSGSGGLPAGMNIASAALVTGSSNFITSWGTPTTTDTSNVVTITGFAADEPSGADDRTVTLGGITNGSTIETPYYVLFKTFSNADCSTGMVDSAIVSFVYAEGQVVSLTVSDTLSFDLDPVSGTQPIYSGGANTTVATTDGTIPFTGVTASANAIAAHDLTVNTNSAGGYSIYIRYTGALSSAGADTITDHTGSNASPSAFPAAGTEAFGYSTDDDSLSVAVVDRFAAHGWAAFTTSNAEVAYHGAPISNDTTRVAYQVGIAGTTEAGDYTTTVIYTATPTY